MGELRWNDRQVPPFCFRRQRFGLRNVNFRLGGLQYGPGMIKSITNMKHVSVLLVLLLALQALIIGGGTRDKGLCGMACCKLKIACSCGLPSSHILLNDAGRFPVSSNDASMEPQDDDPAYVSFRPVRLTCLSKEVFRHLPPRLVSSTLVSIRTVTLQI